MTVSDQLPSVLDDAAKLFDLINKSVQVAAYAIGAGWIVWNFARNRTNIPRLKVSVGACVQRQALQTYLLASMTIENPSQRIVKIGLNDSFLLILKRKSPDAKVTKIRYSEWDVKGGDYAFKWRITPTREEDDFLAIEPGTTIAHEQLIELDEVGENTSFLLLLWIKEWTKEQVGENTSFLLLLWIKEWAKKHSWGREHSRAARLLESLSRWFRALPRSNEESNARFWRATKVVIVDKA